MSEETDLLFLEEMNLLFVRKALWIIRGFRFLSTRILYYESFWNWLWGNGLKIASGFTCFFFSPLVFLHWWVCVKQHLSIIRMVWIVLLGLLTASRWVTGRVSWKAEMAKVDSSAGSWRNRSTSRDICPIQNYCFRTWFFSSFQSVKLAVNPKQSM